MKSLKPLNAIAVENPCLPGTPDVNYIEGWIELKWIRAWPKRADTPVKISHYTKQQRVWAFRRRRAGGQCWLLLQVRMEWILLDGAVAALWLNKCTKRELIEKAALYSNSGLPAQTLMGLLTRGQDPYTFTTEDFTRLRETE